MISHIMFDIYHMSDPSESIMIMMVQKLRYDPTLGHNYLREFFFGYATILFDVLH